VLTLPFTVGDVARVTAGELLTGNASRVVKGISLDSRHVRPGDLFIALRGERVDGHNFVSEALDRGAAAALIQRQIPLQEKATILKVKDCQRALLDLSAWYRRRFSAVAVGITGSTGKTTTKEMVAAVLGQSFRVHKSKGNYNTEIGIPLTIFALRPEQEIAVLEMGMRGLGQIRHLSQVAAPQIGVITNIGLTHLELLQTTENIARAKGELLEELPATGTAILNGDDMRLRRLGQNFSGQVLFYGLGEENDFRVLQVRSHGKRGISFTARTPGGVGEMELPLPGRHNAINALAALAVGHCFGMSLSDMARGLKGLQPSTMRLAISSTLAGVTIINDAYNANPTSMESGLLTLMEMKGLGRTVAVLGDMLELGPVAATAHREVGEMAARLGVDLLLTIGNWREEILAGAQGMGMSQGNCRAFGNKKELVIFLQKWLQPADTVLIKASRGMQLEDIAAELHSLGDDKTGG